jgi:hypothetical protein
MNTKIEEIESFGGKPAKGYTITINGRVHQSSIILERDLRSFKPSHIRDFKAKFIKSVANEYYNAIMKLGDPS